MTQHTDGRVSPALNSKTRRRHICHGSSSAPHNRSSACPAGRAQQPCMLPACAAIWCRCLAHSLTHMLFPAALLLGCCCLAVAALLRDALSRAHTHVHTHTHTLSALAEAFCTVILSRWWSLLFRLAGLQWMVCLMCDRPCTCTHAHAAAAAAAASKRGNGEDCDTSQFHVINGCCVW